MCDYGVSSCFYHSTISIVIFFKISLQKWSAVCKGSFLHSRVQHGPCERVWIDYRPTKDEFWTHRNSLRCLHYANMYVGSSGSTPSWYWYWWRRGWGLMRGGHKNWYKSSSRSTEFRVLGTGIGAQLRWKNLRESVRFCCFSSSRPFHLPRTDHRCK